MNRKIVFRTVLFLVLILILSTSNFMYITPSMETIYQKETPMKANFQTIQPLVSDMRKSSSDIDPLSSRAFNSFVTQEDYNRIYIQGNTDFHTQASEKNWPGNGSQVAPYIIEDQVFTTNCFIYNTSILKT